MCSKNVLYLLVVLKHILDQKNNVKFSLSFGHFAGAKNSKEKYWEKVKTALAGGQIAVIILAGLIVLIGEIVDPKFFINKG